MSGGLRISCFDACALQEDDTRRFWTKPLGQYFNPRPPCGGRPRQPLTLICDYPISIHVLRVEDDFDYLRDNMATSKFQSTSSMWRTTRFLHQEHGRKRFQSTSSMWRTTRNLSAGSCGYNISIHVLRVEDDFAQLADALRRCGFQSTSSVWRTTQACNALTGEQAISIHVLRVEDDRTRRLPSCSP